MTPSLTTATCAPRTDDHREFERVPLAVAGRLVWKDARGTTRFNSVVIRDVSDTGAYVESLSGAAIPLYRLVSLQAERTPGIDQLPACLRQGRVLSAVYRVGASRPSTGTPEGYGLRLLVEPRNRTGMAARPEVPVELVMTATA